MAIFFEKNGDTSYDSQKFAGSMYNMILCASFTKLKSRSRVQSAVKNARRKIIKLVGESLREFGWNLASYPFHDRNGNDNGIDTELYWK